MLNRKCVVVRWAELSYESFMELVERGAGSIIILLPLDIVSVDKKLIEVSGSAPIKAMPLSKSDFPAPWQAWEANPHMNLHTSQFKYIL